MDSHDPDWFARWAMEHMARLPRHDWPPMRTPEEMRHAMLFLDSWREAFARHKLDYPTLAEASRRIAESRLFTISHHLPALLEAARDVIADRGPDPGSREAAAARSADCRHCEGGGLSPVHRRAVRHGAPVIITVSAYCTCPHGCWIRDNHRAHSRDLYERTPDLADVLAGKPPWKADVPTLEKSEA